MNLLKRPRDQFDNQIFNEIKRHKTNNSLNNNQIEFNVMSNMIDEKLDKFENILNMKFIEIKHEIDNLKSRIEKLEQYINDHSKPKHQYNYFV